MIIEPRLVKLSTRTGVEVKRSIPHAKLKTIGAWCFIDHFGPTEQTDGMVVAKHPHIGLQTVTWLIEGKVEHRDSLGSVQEILPGQVNIMTAGKGIVHSERTAPPDLARERKVFGIQSWVALPKSHEEMAPAFDHVAAQELPVVEAPVVTR